MRRSVLAALLAASCAGPAAAADRGTPPAFGIEAPRDCGPEGFALPGSAGCVRLGGSVSVTTRLRTGGAAAQAPARRAFTTSGNGRLAADVRVPTDLGPFRVYTAVRIAGPGGAGRPR